MIVIATNKDNFHRIFGFFLHLVATETDQTEKCAEKNRADRRPLMQYAWKSLIKIFAMAQQ